MKAKISLEVEIDLEQVIDYNNLEALKRFTSSTDKEGVGTFYVQNVARAITNVSEINLPHVAYGIKAEIFDTGQKAVAQEGGYEQLDLNKFMLEGVADGEDVDLDDEQEEQKTVIDREPIPSYAKEVVYDKITKLVQNLVEEKGFPKYIYIAPELFDLAFVNEDKMIKTFMGCEVIKSELENAIVQIAYEPFGKEKEVEFFSVETL